MKNLRLFTLIAFFSLLSLLSPATYASLSRPPRSFFLPVLPTITIPSSWQIECVDAPKRFEEMEDRSLALDASGYPHLAYGADFLYYASYDGTTWRLETVDDSGSVGSFAALALDGQGNPHIAYIDTSRHSLKYAFHDAEGWHVQTVVGNGQVDGTTSIALDKAGYPHLTYAVSTSSTDADLRYNYWDGSS
jgi:hypothetical protein